MNRRPARPGESQGGSNKGHLDPKTDREKKSIYPDMVVKYVLWVKKFSSDLSRPHFGGWRELNWRSGRPGEGQGP